MCATITQCPKMPKRLTVAIPKSGKAMIDWYGRSKSASNAAPVYCPLGMSCFVERLTDN